MTENELSDQALLAHEFTYRNNRGSYKTDKGGYVRYGIPEPPSGRKEKDWEMKGGDRIGFEPVEITPEMVGSVVAVFTNIELKTENDRLKKGQINWHNFIIENGGISEIWKAKPDGEIEIIRERIDD